MRAKRRRLMACSTGVSFLCRSAKCINCSGNGECLARHCRDLNITGRESARNVQVRVGMPFLGLNFSLGRGNDQKESIIA